MTPRRRYDRVLHALALATAVATFPLIFMGGLVTSHHAGMSVPDWPNSYGYNMFLFPPRFWVGGILYEHTHRLMGTVVGMLSIVMCAWAWRPVVWGRTGGSGAIRFFHERRLRLLCLGVLGGVLLQGILGGLRVVLVKLNLAIVHACVAQAFFCLTVFAATSSSLWWNSAPRPRVAPGAGWLIGSALALVVVIYLQLIVAATMRHYDAGLAIPDLPLTYGHWLPPFSQTRLQSLNHLRAWELNLDPVTLGQIWVAYAHRVGAVLVSLAAGVTILLIFRQFRERKLRAPAAVLLVLLLAQVTLGVLTVLMRKPADVASAHVAIGALVLVTAFLILVRAVRLYRVTIEADERHEVVNRRALASDDSPLLDRMSLLTH